MAEKITKRLVDTYNPTGRLEFIWDTEVKGFGLVITPAGTKSFILNYRNQDNRSRRKTIGKYGHLTVEQARELAKELCYRISKGEDPVQHDGLLRKQPIFKEVAQRFLDEHSAVRLRAATHRSNLQYVDHMLVPFFGKMKIRSIERRDVQDYISKNKHRKIGCNRSSPRSSKRCCAA